MHPQNEEHWISQDTAILVVHGIGNQKPLETLDLFARSLIESFEESPKEYRLSHQVAEKPRSGKGFWYDNFIRIEKPGSPHGCHLDIYEYYWANLTQDLASSEDIGDWVRGVVKGAKKFYERNMHLLEIEDNSFFKKGGRPWRFKYWLFLKIAIRFIPAMQKAGKAICYLLSKIPVAGWAFLPFVDSLKKRIKLNVENIVGDIIVYNSLDAKSEFYEVRKSILDGAVSALRYLIEPDGSSGNRFRYDRVVVAGHSLGSQISFDAINRLTHHISMGNVEGYKADGSIRNAFRQQMDERYHSVNDVLSGLITFGSPLDKIAFFLWEQAEEDQYLRAQILKHYHCFKQRGELFQGGESEDIAGLASPFRPLFDNIRWYNFYDQRDYVSGHLDFYNQDLMKNIDCDFESNFYEFTHSWYWREGKMFKKIIDDFLMTKQPPKVGGKS